MVRASLVWLASLTLSATTMAADRVIARVGNRTVTYADVWCNPDVAEKHPAWLNGRSVADACADAERKQFGHVVGRLLVEKACEIHKCGPSDAEIDRFRSHILKDESMLRRLALEGRRVPEAVRRVYRGEDIEAVYEDAIKSMGKPLEAFRNEVAMYRSLDVVERYLAKDFVATAREQFESRARYQAMRAAVRKRIELLAEAQKKSLDATADDYLKVVIGQVGLTILDDNFHIPPGREVFL